MATFTLPTSPLPEPAPPPRERRLSRDDRRGGPRDRRRRGEPRRHHERRRGRPDRRFAHERRHRRAAHPGPLDAVDPVVLFWALNAICWAAIAAVVLIWGMR